MAEILSRSEKREHHRLNVVLAGGAGIYDLRGTNYDLAEHGGLSGRRGTAIFNELQRHLPGVPGNSRFVPGFFKNYLGEAVL